MNFLNVLACPEELDVLIKIIKIFLNGVRYIIPIVLIVIGTVDLAKAVLAKDDEATKKEQKHLVTRVIYAIIIFLVPTIVMVIFNVLSKSGLDNGGSQPASSGTYSSWTEWKECWKSA